MLCYCIGTDKNVVRNAKLFPRIIMSSLNLLGLRYFTLLLVDSGAKMNESLSAVCFCHYGPSSYCLSQTRSVAHSSFKARQFFFIKQHSITICLECAYWLAEIFNGRFIANSAKNFENWTKLCRFLGLQCR